jgi:hypothetical protein
MRDFEKTTDPSSDDPHGVVKPRGHSHAEGHTVSPVPMHADAAPLSVPELTHPANAAPLADLLTGLQHSHGNVHVQRVVAEMNEARSGAESHQTKSGDSLDAAVRTEMESAFGENFGDVRVHTDSDAERMNKELGARAFTRGRDVYFGKGEYEPSTRIGKELIAHEFAHVVQQRDSSGAQNMSVGQAGDSFEQEADRAAAAVLIGERAHITSRTAMPGLQRQTPSQAPPQILRHQEEISWVPVNGRIMGHDFTITYFYNSGFGDRTVLTLGIPEGVEVAAIVPMLTLSAAEYSIINPGGTRSRVATVSVSTHTSVRARFQATFLYHNITYLVIFSFPHERIRAEAG